MFNHHSLMVAYCDANLHYRFVNKSYARKFGYEPEEIMGQHYRMCYEHHESEKIEKSCLPKLIENGSWSGTLKACRKDGSHFTAEALFTVLWNVNHEFDGFICTYRDITEKKQTYDQLEYMAHYDNLTGLPNRDYFNNQLKQMISHAHRCNEMVAIFFLDLDDFKHINDTLGHAAGDSLLQKVTKRLKSLIRGEDLIARFGGDEFTIAIGGMTHHSGAIKLANNILEEFNHPIMLENENMVQKTSIKIDRSFIREIHRDATDKAIVKAIIDLSKSLKMSVIAEGVESAEQLKVLQTLGAHAAQGYYISRPTVAENIDQIYTAIEKLASHPQLYSHLATPTAVPNI